MRFVAAQFEALLADELWLRHGRHANAMAARLASGAATIDGVEITQQVHANAVFARLPRASVKRLQAWSPFYVWAPGADTDDPVDEVRWMTSFETSESDVDRFLDGIRAEMSGRT
jgi:threonine aldolase